MATSNAHLYVDRGSWEEVAGNCPGTTLRGEFFTLPVPVSSALRGTARRPPPLPLPQLRAAPRVVFSLNFVKKLLPITKLNFLSTTLFLRNGFDIYNFSKVRNFCKCLKTLTWHINLRLKFTRFCSFRTMSPCDTTLKLKGNAGVWVLL